MSENTDSADAARRRLSSGMHRACTAHLDLAAAARGFAATLSGLVQAAAEADAKDLAAHPDLTYLDVQMRGFYGQE